MSCALDLHVHSTASDGALTPSELVQLALSKNLCVIALTDHDTTDGVQEALEAARGTRLTIIPGVEISTDVPGNHELHILGYYVDHTHGPLQQRLQALRESRLDRARRMVDLLAQAGYPLPWHQLLDLAGPGSIGRPHIAQAMVEARYVSSVESAFQHYLGRGGLAYVERAKLRPREAVELVLAAGGAPVLAHPSRVIEHLPDLVRAGLVGLEVYYNGYEEAEKQFLARLAQKHNLIPTGGSDFHGPGITSASEPGRLDIPYESVERLEAFHKAHVHAAGRRPTISCDAPSGAER